MTEVSAATDVSAMTVRQARDRGIEALVELQLPSGSWPGENLAGPQYSAMVIITEQHFGVLKAEDAARARRRFESVQLPDGGFPPTAGAAEADLSATALVIAALTAVAAGNDEPMLERASAWLTAAGGWQKADLPTRIFGALAGLVDPADLPHGSFMLAWIPFGSRIVGHRFQFGVVLMLYLLGPLLQGLKNGGPLSNHSVVQRFQNRRIARYLTRHQNRLGSWAGLVNTTTLGMIALRYLGVSPDDERITKGLAFLDHCKIYRDDGLQCMPYSSENWNTAGVLATLLGEADEVPLPAVQRGIDYLLTQQNLEGVPRDWQNPHFRAPTSGGWSYGFGNLLSTDSDTTAYVLEALDAASRRGLKVPASVVENGRRWLLSMQNRSGGWPAFTRGLKDKPPGPMAQIVPQLPHGLLGALRVFLFPPVELGDPAWADVTGRVIRSLIAQGVPATSPEINRAAAFLQHQLGQDDAWWGRWELNYIAASGYILTGLAAAGCGRLPWVERVGRWLASAQNRDGGWGETARSYVDPATRGQGASDPAVTAFALSGLLALGRLDATVEAGIGYLLAQQQPDGLWNVSRALGVLAPPAQFYTNTLNGQCVVMDVLLRYAAAAKARS